MITGYLNLRKHLANEHPATYDKAIVDNGWNYRFSSDVKSGKSNAIEPQTCSLPPFTQSSFIDHIIRFVVADDQVSDAFSESVTGHLKKSPKNQRPNKALYFPKGNQIVKMHYYNYLGL